MGIGCRAAAGVATLLLCTTAADAGTWRSEDIPTRSLCGTHFGPLSYHWPVFPFDQPHPIRGNFGDPRTVFRAGEPSTVSERGSFVFHNGVDIEAKAGRDVYPVVSGVVTKVRDDEIVVESSQSRTFQYWHLAPAVRPGEEVVAGRSVLGSIRPEAHHVHLTELDDGLLQNPLAPGHLTPYSDSIPPTVDSIMLLDARGHAVPPAELRGQVEIVASAYDLPSLPVEGAWLDMPVAPAALEWRLTARDGEEVVPERVAVDFRASLPIDRDFWDVYSHGTYQNFPTVGREFLWGTPGRYLFDLAPRSLDTERIPRGSYLLTVTALDVCGNSGSLTERVRVLPHASASPAVRRARRLLTWPEWRSAYTVILESFPLSDGPGAARAAARQAVVAGLRRIGILVEPGFYSVFSGVYGNADNARRALERIAPDFPAAYPRRISS